MSHKGTHFASQSILPDRRWEFRFAAAETAEVREACLTLTRDIRSQGGRLLPWLRRN
jgi:hypothetical protein